MNRPRPTGETIQKGDSRWMVEQGSAMRRPEVATGAFRLQPKLTAQTVSVGRDRLRLMTQGSRAEIA